MNTTNTQDFNQLIQRAKDKPFSIWNIIRSAFKVTLGQLFGVSIGYGALYTILMVLIPFLGYNLAGLGIDYFKEYFELYMGIFKGGSAENFMLFVQTYQSQQNTATIIILCLQFLMFPMYIGYTVLVDRKCTGQSYSFATIFSPYVSPRIVNFFGLMLLIYLIVMVGFVMFIIPGIIACLTMPFAMYILWFHSQGVTSSIKSAWYLSKPKMLSVFLTFLLYVCISIAILIIFIILLTIILGLTGKIQQSMESPTTLIIAYAIGYLVLGIVLMPVNNILGYFIYKELMPNDMDYKLEEASASEVLGE